MNTCCNLLYGALGGSATSAGCHDVALALVSEVDVLTDIQSFPTLNPNVRVPGPSSEPMLTYT